MKLTTRHFSTLVSCIDILNFINGRKQHYFYGTARYGVGYCDNQPFYFVLSDELLAAQEDPTELHRAHLSKDGKTISLDFGIGNKDLLGKGLAAPTLVAFTRFYQGNRYLQLAPSRFLVMFTNLKYFNTIVWLNTVNNSMLSTNMT